MVKILHFADAHIDMAKLGQHDPVTGLPIRVMDFLKSLDTIVDTAITEKVDLVIFAGDAYRDPSPAPTFQREWGKRIMRLSRASIPTILLTGNHDLTPSQLRAHAIQEFATLEVPFVHVVNKPELFGPADLENVPVQVIALPWITRALVKAAVLVEEKDEHEDINTLIEESVTNFIDDAINNLEPDIPVILTAHASIQGAIVGDEKLLKIGRDVALQPGLVRNPVFDYVALGHIHKYQNLNEGSHPPVIYSGSIERVDFGEINEEKGFVIAEVDKGKTEYTWHKLATRPFIDRRVVLEDNEGVMDKLLASLPSEEAMDGAIVRLTVELPKAYDALVDEVELRRKAHRALIFSFTRSHVQEARARLPQGQETSSLTPVELLDLYWKENHIAETDRQELQKLADQIISDVNLG